MKGKVKFFNKQRGYGFITDSNKLDYFVHLSYINDKKPIEDGQNVEFEIEKSNRGLEAKNVRVV